MNAGTRLQKFWRWNHKPLRVKIDRLTSSIDGGTGFKIAWYRWDFRRQMWQEWRAFIGFGTLAETVKRYRDYADGWRGCEV